MDPLSVTASIVTVLQTTGFLLQYVNSIKSAGQEQAKFAIELAKLTTCLTMLRHRVSQSHGDECWFRQVKLLGAPDGVLNEMSRALILLKAKVEAPRTKRTKVKATLTWKFDKSEVLEILAMVGRLQTIVNLALHDDQFQLSLAIKDGITQQTESLSRLELNGNQQARQVILKWLRPPDVSTSFMKAILKRHTGSGTWLLNNKQFSDWLQQPGTLFLSGKPGCGKTILSSIIIETLHASKSRADSTAIAYFFFEFDDPSKLSTRDLLVSLATQLATTDDQTFHVLEMAHREHAQKHSLPDNQALCVLIKSLIAQVKHAFIVIDAADECSTGSDLFNSLHELRESSPESLHLLVVSRSDRRVRDAIVTMQAVELDLRPEYLSSDIHQYILHRLEHDTQLKKWPPQTRDKIVATLDEKSDGMFRWTYCQLEELRKCIKPKALRKALEALPATLDETYARIIQQISDQGYLDDALRIFQWLCYSRRELTLSELVEILAIEIEGSNTLFDEEDRIPDAEDILIMASSLVIIDPGPDTTSIPGTADTRTMADGAMPPRSCSRSVVRLAHYSVAEYLMSSRCQFQSHLLRAHAEYTITRSLVTYLLHVCHRALKSVDIHQDYPLATYAAYHWTYHLHDMNQDLIAGSFLDEALRLFEDTRHGLDAWRQIADLDVIRGCYMAHEAGMGNIQLAFKRTFNVRGSPFYYACLTGNVKLVEGVLRKSTPDLNERGGIQGFPLGAACCSRKADLIRMLCRLEGLDQPEYITPRAFGPNATHQIVIYLQRPYTTH